jgi:hypothetical protein
LATTKKQENNLKINIARRHASVARNSLESPHPIWLRYSGKKKSQKIHILRSDLWLLLLPLLAPRDGNAGNAVACMILILLRRGCCISQNLSKTPKSSGNLPNQLPVATSSEALGERC